MIIGEHNSRHFAKGKTVGEKSNQWLPEAKGMVRGWTTMWPEQLF